ncbi:hypothetical protein JOC48_001977 [Aquibacillus albus]|uniref:Uncharacterized protein n=2 Tax=Aquibacillus albus TaxID=1168171 RepID=A0ABS2N022_9BACI|nr:CBO0543 family protein [Aquibacillus albus]MBM7571481.1 hypothetical protein [Aquibacillus albus]
MGFNWKLLRAAHVIIVTPLLVLLFLSKYPKSLLERIAHIIKWVLGASSVEYVVHKQKMIQYKHGWNIFWSSLIYLMMFVYSSLFTKRPLLTCFLTVCSIVFFISKFKLPIKSKHPFSRRIDMLVDSFYHSFLEDIF